MNEIHDRMRITDLGNRLRTVEKAVMWIIVWAFFVSIVALTITYRVFVS